MKIKKLNKISAIKDVRVLMLFVLIILLGYLSFIFAIPLTSFVNPTPATNTWTTNTSFIVNTSIVENSLGSLIYNWNGTNYTIYDDSLLLMYNFENLSSLGENSTYVVDVSKYGNNLTCSVCPTSINGKYGKAYNYSGSSSDYTSQNNLGISGNNPRTIAFWAKLESTADNQVLVSTGSAGSNQLFAAVIFGGSWYFNAYATNDWDTDIAPDTNLNFHVLTYNGSRIRWYINGQELGSGVDRAINTVDNKVKIGYRIDDWGDLNGWVDELRIWNRSLSANEIYQQYISNLQKFNSTQWYFYANQSKNATSVLANGTYTYQTFATNSSGSINSTELRTLNIGTLHPQLNFTFPTPANGISTTNTSFIVNVSISSINPLSSLIYNFNNTNYTIYNDSLVLMMNFDNRSSLGENATYAVDVSGKGNNARVISSTWNSSGKYNGAYQYSGNSQYLSIADSNMLDGSVFTFSAWVNYFGGSVTWNRIASKKNANTDNNGWEVTLWSGSNTDIYLAGSSSTNVRLACVSNWVGTGWHHVLVVYNNTNVSLYCDGASKGSGTIVTPAANTENLRLGIVLGEGLTGANLWNGLIDEVRIWNRTLNTNEAYQEYASNLNKFNSTQWYFYANQSKNATAGLDYGNYTYQIFASDLAGNMNSTEQRTITISENVWPRINLDWIYPTGNINVSQNQFFNISVNVSCINSDCGEINITLDPVANTVYNFTTCGKTGNTGPNQTQCNTNYTGTTLAGLVNVTSGYQRWVVPRTGKYRIEANGAGGGLVSCSGYYRGSGARVIGEFDLSAGDVLFIVVGQQGSDKSCSDWGGGGGGFSAVAKNVTSSDYRMNAVYPGTNVTPLIVAGGAGGTGDDGGNSGNPNATSFISGTGSGGINGSDSGGGGGFIGDGAQGLCGSTGAKSFLNGSNGTICSYTGGFGGGGAPFNAGGGGGGFTGGNGSANAYSAFGGTSYNSGTNQTNVSAANSGPGYVRITDITEVKSGIVSMNTSATPFYTNVTNPYNLTLNEGESQIITWWVNATGSLRDYTFFVYTNLTSNQSIYNQTSKINITIKDITYPIINITYPLNRTYNYNVTNLNYTYSDVNPGYCWYSNNSGIWNSSSVSAGTNFTINITGNSSTFTVYCNDSSGNFNSTSITFNVRIPKINLDLLYPNSSVNVSQNEFFNVSVNVSCIDGNCEEFNVTLDPETNTVYNFTTCNVSGPLGPTQTNCTNAYAGTTLNGLVSVGNSTNNSGIQFWTVPSTGTYRIEAVGAGGGYVSSTPGGYGARMIGNFSLTAGQMLKILVGQNGSSGTAGGGGGGTFVALSDNTPLIIAGGGGGAYGLGKNASTGTAGGNSSTYAGGINGLGGNAGWGSSGGGGFYGNGTAGSQSYTKGIAFISNGSGGTGCSSGNGGFGGGGGSEWCSAGASGAGGGYSGGAGTDNAGGRLAGGGGSFNNGTSQINTAGVNLGNGYVTITFTGTAKEGTVSMNTSATPFYTTTQNPYNLSLNEGESSIITWLIKAVGAINSVFEFFVYANLTSNYDVGNQTQKWNVTIKDTTAPTINITYPLNRTYNYNPNSLNYSYSDYNSGGNCWYSNNSGIWNSSSVSAGTNFTINITGNSSTFTVYCNDSSGNFNSTDITFSIRIPSILIDLIYPTTNVNVTQLDWFNVSVNVSCVNGNCEEINVSLDPVTNLVINGDFELGNMNGWTTYGSANWSAQSTTKYEGTYAGKSGTIGNSVYTVIEQNVTLASAATLNFWWSVSSENGCDYLGFCVDKAYGATGCGFISCGTANGNVTSITGSVSWTKVQVNLSQGIHRLLWYYAKDGSVATGSDAGWLDNVSIMGNTGKGELISMVEGDTPFYTNVTNPYNLTLNEGQSQIITWWVNATGTTPNTPYEFYVYVNLTNNLNVGNQTTKWNVTIKDIISPIINITFPLNTTYNYNVSAINYTYNDYSGNGYCWYSNNSGIWNSTTYSAGTNITNVKTVDGSNTFIVYCNDSSGNFNYSESVTFFRDAVYPLFSNYWSNNATMNGSGVAVFNVTILNTNGTVFLELNGANYTANNISANIWNYSLALTNGTYQYKWISWGNYTLKNFNVSNNFSYILYSNLRIINITAMNASNISGVAIPQGRNVTINAYIENSVSVLLKIWRAFIGGQILWQGFMTNAITNLWNATIAVNSTFPVGEINYTVIANDSLRYQMNLSDTFNVTDTTVPIVNLISPANNTFSINATIYFSANISDNYILANSTLFIWNSTGSEINSSSLIIQTISNLSNISVTLPYNDVVKWNYYACDNSSNCAFNRTNWTITYDNILPAVDITYPLNTSYNINVRALNYIYSDVNANGYCWYSNNSGIWNSSSVSAGTNFTNVNSSEGSNTWTVYCNDSSGNVNSSSVTFVKDTPQIIISMISPTGNINATQNQFFSVIANVSCSNTNCGEINVTLDPAANTVYNFTTCGASGRIGPNQTQCNTNYTGTSLDGLVSVGNGTQNWTVPATGTYTITAYGARGGLGYASSSLTNKAGYGAKMSGSFYLESGQVLKILVGQMGKTQSKTDGGGGGGGGTFVALSDNTPLIVAGGGGGAGGRSTSIANNASITVNGTKDGTNQGTAGSNGTGGLVGSGTWGGGGGGGYYTNGTTGGNGASKQGIAFISGCYGGINYTDYPADGGFGGGGGVAFAGGGGGGYSGGAGGYGGGEPYSGGGGGGSYNSGTNQTNLTGANYGDGYVIIAFTGSTKVGTVSMNMSATPFYTTTQNPYNLSLNEGQSQIITWTINATGSLNTLYEFFVYANLTADYSLGNQTAKWNITIVNGSSLIAPSVNIVYPVSGGNYSINISQLNYTVSGDNLSSCWHSTNSGGINSTSYSAGTNFTDLTSSEGSNSWIVYCNSTNNATGSGSVTFIKDTVYPIIDFGVITADDNAILNKNFTFVNVSVIETNFKNITFYIFNNSGLVNSTTFTTQIYTINWTNLKNNIYYYNITVYDSAGNYNSTSTRTLTLDTTAPNATLVSPSNATISNNEIYNFTANLSDSLSGIKNTTLNIYNNSNALINQTTQTYSSGTLTSTVGIVVTLTNGVYKWFYNLFDYAGNTFTTANNTLTVDTVLPRINITYPLNISYRINVSNINYTYSDTNANGSCWYSNNFGMNNYSIQTRGINFTNITSTEGSNSWTVYCNDTAGNINFSSITFLKDTISPIVNITYPLNNTNYNINISSINYTINDANPARCWYSNNSGIWNSTAIAAGTNFTNATSVEGINNWRVYCNDSAGNINSSSMSFFKDTVYPLINFTSPTSSNGSFSSNNFIIVNTSISELNLNSIIYNFNNTNYTIYNDSLVLIMNFDNRSSLGENATYVVDVSRYGNNGTRQNHAFANITGGKYNGALQLDGNDDYIDLGIPTSTRITDNITLSAWIKTPATSSAYRDVIANQWNYQDSGIMLTTYGTSTLHVPYSNGSSFTYLDGTYTIGDNNWHFIATTFSSGNLKIYADGNLINSSTSATLTKIGYNGVNHLLIGKDSGTGGTEYFQGLIDEVRIWNRSLSADEIYQQYVSNLQKFNQTQWYLYVNQSKNATTGLSDGQYNHQVSAADSFGNLNQTEIRYITIDSTSPNATLISPSNSSVSSNLTLNFTANISDNIGIKNATLNIWNQTSLVNRTLAVNYSSTGTFTKTIGIVVTLTNGVYKWFYHVFDFAGNQFTTNNNTLSIDVVYPIFSNYSDNNNTLYGNGIAWFNVTARNTNGTVWLQIDNTNITATNLSSNVYNVSYSFSSNGSYNYTWYAYGNGTISNLNNSITRDYFVNPPTGRINLNMIYPTENLIVNKGSWFNVSVNVSCTSADCGEINVSLDPETSTYPDEIDKESNENIRFEIMSATTLYDNKSFSYDIYDGCSINNGQSDVFDGGYYLYINGSQYTGTRSTFEDNNREAVCNGQLKSGINVSRKVYVPTTENWARFLEIFQNNNATATFCINVSIYSNMGSDSGTKYINTSDLNNTWEINDNWMVWDDYSLTSGDDAAGFIYQTASSSEKITWKNIGMGSPDNVYFGWGSICIAPGHTKILMHIFTQMDTMAQSVSQSQNILSDIGNSKYISGMSSSEISQLINLGFTSAKGGLITTNSSAIPFYTNTSNPYTISLSQNQSQIITWWVNATGTGSNYTFFVYANRTNMLSISNISSLWNVSIYETPVVSDTSYPLFYNYIDNNASITSQGIARFNVSVNNTNGTVWLRINNNNYFAVNLSSNVYNVSISGLTNGTYIYNWSAYGNGASKNLNTSINRYYLVNLADTTSPAITLITPSNTTYSTTTIGFNISLNENANWCGYSLDGNTNISMTINSTYRGANATNQSMAQGSHIVVFSCNDSSGNINSTSRIFSIDTIAPYVGFASPVNTTYRIKTLSINITNNSDARMVWYNRGLGNETYTTNVTKTFSEGSTTIYAYANDSIGNLNSTSITFFIDSIAPSITINTPLEQTYTTNTLVFNVSTNENSNCLFALNSTNNYTMQNNGNRNFNYTINLLADGTYSVIYYCNDSLNNIGTGTRLFGVKTVPPQITLNAPASNIYYRNSSIIFNYTPMATNGLSTCELWGNWTGTWHKNQSTTSISNYSNNYFYQNLSDGMYIWNIWCNNTGNQYDWSTQGNITFAIDRTPPSISFVTPVNTSYNTSIIKIEIVNNTDAKNIWWNNGTANISYSNYIDLSLPNGRYTYISYANDSAGNINSSVIAFDVDTSLPVFFNYWDNNASLIGNGTAKFNVTVNNTNGTVFLNINGQSILARNLTANVYNASYYFSANTTYEYYWTGYSNGTSHLFGASDTRDYTINNTDVISPSITLINPANATITNSLNYNFTANLSDNTDTIGDTESGIKNTTLNIYNNSNALINQTTQTYSSGTLTSTVGIVVTLTNGVYKWFYNLFDYAGNTFVSDNRTFIKDNVSPAINISSPLHNSVSMDNELNILYSVNENYPDSCWYAYDSMETNNSLSSCSNITEITWSSGQHNITIWTNDSAGNINSSSATFTIDKDSPIVTLNSPEDAYSNDSASRINVTFNCSATDDYGLANISLYITNNLNTGLSLNSTRNISGLSNYSTWTLNLYRGNYTWNCLVSDNVGHSDFASSSRTLNLNFSDSDNDDISDGEDNLKGNESNINNTGVNRMNITVGGNSTYGSYNDVQEVAFFDSVTKIVNFTYNFTSSPLDLSLVTIIKTTNSLIVNLSGQLQSDYRKSIYIEDNDFASLCVKDSEISSISEISENCNQDYETDFTLCLGNNTGVTIGNLTCAEENTTIRVDNLTYSAIRGTPETTEEEDTTVTATSGGGGGGGTPVKKIVSCSNDSDCGKEEYCFENVCYKNECSDNSQCRDGTFCWQGRCVKLFDIKIMEIESPIDTGNFIHFTYYLKAMANINNDVIVKFWLEKDGKKISSGKDTIFIGNFEEKTEESKIFIPGNTPKGVYEFYVSVNYDKYSAESSKLIQIDENGNIFTLTSSGNILVYVVPLLLMIIILLVLVVLKLQKKKIKNFYEYEEEWILTHKLFLAIIYLGLALFGLMLVLGYFDLINLPGLEDYLGTGEIFVKYIISPYIFYIFIITLGIIIGSLILKNKKYPKHKKIIRKNYLEHVLKRIRKRTKQHGMKRRVKILEKKGYDTDIIKRGKTHFNSKLRAWKRKGYDTELIEKNPMKKKIEEWRKRGYKI